MLVALEFGGLSDRRFYPMLIPRKKTLRLLREFNRFPIPAGRDITHLIPLGRLPPRHIVYGAGHTHDRWTLNRLPIARWNGIIMDSPRKTDIETDQGNGSTRQWHAAPFLFFFQRSGVSDPRHGTDNVIKSQVLIKAHCFCYNVGPGFQCENCFVSLVTSSAVMTKGSPFQNGGLTRVRLHPPTTNKPRSTPSPCCGPDSTATVALQCQVNKGTLLRKKGCQALPEELSNKKPGFRRLEEGFG